MNRAVPWLPVAFALLLYAPLPMLLDEVDACYYVERASGIAAGEIRREFDPNDWYVRDPKAYRTGVVLPLAGMISLFGHGAFAYRLLPVLYAAGIAGIVGHLAAREWGRRFGAFLGCLVVPLPILLVQTLRPGAGLPLVFWLGVSYVCLERSRVGPGETPFRNWFVASGFCWGLAYLHHEIAVGFLAVILPDLSLPGGSIPSPGAAVIRLARRAACVATGLLPCLLFEWVFLGALTGDPLIRANPVSGRLLDEANRRSPAGPGGKERTVGTYYWERTVHGYPSLLLFPDGVTRTRYGAIFLLALAGVCSWGSARDSARRWIWWIAAYVFFLNYMPARPWQPFWGGNYPVIPVDGRHLAVLLVPAILLCGRVLHELVGRQRILCAGAGALCLLSWLWGDIAWIWDGIAKVHGIRQVAGLILADPGKTVYTGDRAAGLLRIHLLAGHAADRKVLASVASRVRVYGDLLRERPAEAVVFHHYPSLWEYRERYGSDPVPCELAALYPCGEMLARYVPRHRPSFTGFLRRDSRGPVLPGEDPMRSELWRLRRAGP